MCHEDGCQQCEEEGTTQATALVGYERGAGIQEIEELTDHEGNEMNVADHYDQIVEAWHEWVDDQITEARRDA